MRMSQRLGWLAGMALAVAMASTAVLAQEGGRPERGRDGERTAQRGGEERGGDMEARRAEMQKRMAERMKENLEATDEEWTLLQPLLEKVQTLQMQARGGQGMMGGRRGGPEAGSPPGDARSNNEVAKIQQELRALLENKDADPAQIKSKLDALRSARETLKAELTTAQQALREVLSQRQEAQLVMMGILE